MNQFKFYPLNLHIIITIKNKHIISPGLPLVSRTQTPSARSLVVPFAATTRALCSAAVAQKGVFPRLPLRCLRSHKRLLHKEHFVRRV